MFFTLLRVFNVQISYLPPSHTARAFYTYNGVILQYFIGRTVLTFLIDSAHKTLFCSLKNQVIPLHYFAFH